MLSRGLAAVLFLTMVAFWPWWEGGGLTPRWAVLAVGFAALLVIVRIRPTPAHWWGAAFLAWAALSLVWTPVLNAGLDEMLVLLTLAGGFLIGAELDDPVPAYRWVVIGVAISGVLALAQVAGLEAIPQLAPPAGLFVNRNYLAEIGTLALIIAVALEWWWLVPPVLLAALLPHSRGSLFALAVVALVWLARRSRAAATAALAALALGVALFVMLPPVPLNLNETVSLKQRLAVWRATAEHLTLKGHGVGSFAVSYPLFLPHPWIVDTRPAQAHNEVLHEASELGLPGIALLLGFFVCVFRGRGGLERVLLLALMAIGCWSFPFHIPASAALAGVVAGRLARTGAGLRHHPVPRRGGAFGVLQDPRSPARA